MNKVDTITATKINDLHRDLETLLHTGIEKAVEIGQLLTEKKTELKHGEFGNWIKANLIFTDRTARNYMNLYENKDKVLQAGNISEAYKMLGEGKTETVSDLTILVELINLEIYLTKFCTKFIDENPKGPYYMPDPKNSYHSYLSDYLVKIKKETDEIFNNNKPTQDKIKRINQIMQEAGMVQRKLSEITIWMSRIIGQMLIFSSAKELREIRENNLYTREEVRTNKKLANTSFEMIESIINEHQQWN